MNNIELKTYRITLPTAKEAKEMTINKDYECLIEEQLEEILEAIDNGNTTCILVSSYGMGYYRKESAKEKLEKELINKGYKITESKQFKYIEWS